MKTKTKKTKACAVANLPRTFTSEKEAVYHAMLLWKYLSENCFASKEDYINTYSTEGDQFIHFWNSNCPCCEYYMTLNETKGLMSYDGVKNELCKGCPLINVKLCGFNSYGSAFNLWANLSIPAEDRLKPAKKIYGALLKKYEKLVKKEEGNKK